MGRRLSGRQLLVGALALVYALCYSTIKAGLAFAPPLRYADGYGAGCRILQFFHVVEELQGMILRSAQSYVRSALERFPVVGLLGPRQVGTTTLAFAVAEALGPGATTYLDLESAVDRAKLADPEAYLGRQRGRTTILDEIHRTPDLFSTLRVLVDRRRREGEGAGHFLIIGSASPNLLRQSSESLAGRVAYLELTPVRIDELTGGGAAPPRPLAARRLSRQPARARRRR
jgi:hypothetical protein